MKKISNLKFYYLEVKKGLLKYWKSYLLGALCVFCINALEMIPALAFKEITSRNPIQNQFLYQVVLILVVSFIFIGIFRYGWRYFFMINSRKIEAFYKRELFHNILMGKFNKSQNLNVGETVSLLSQDIYDFRMFLGPGILVLVDIVGYLVCIPVVLYYVLGKIALFLLAPFFIIPVYMIYYNHKINKHFVNSSSLLGKVSDHVYEDTRGVKVFRVLGLLSVRKSKFKGLLHNLEKQRLLPHKFDIFLDMVINVSICLSYGILFIIGIKSMRGELGASAALINMGKVVFTLQIMDKLIWPMIAIGWVASLTQKSFASLKRIRPLFEIDRFENGDVKLSGQLRSISTHDFNFRYPGSNTKIVKDLNLHLSPGEKVGIVGGVAEGKTTLLKVLSGVYDGKEIEESAKIIINEIPYSKLDLDTYRKKLSYVPQEPVIFNTTLAANICPIGIPNRQKVIRAIEHACLTQDVGEMPEGINTFLGEKGINLSGGQKQRIAIARSFYSKAEIYFWDDSISALDVKTEKHVIDSIFKINQNSILVLATHRLSALRNFDKILVIENGIIVEQGKYRDLVENKSWFYKVQQAGKETSQIRRENIRVE
jgi:ATP-binding cassette subfamily B protein